jgi:Zn-dependent M28 family amino/carboxypeptidase
VIWRLSSVAVLALVLVVGAVAGAPAEPHATDQVSVRLAGIKEHLSAFEEIAKRNGGNRLAGTSGYDASAAYVARRMRAAGYRVRFQEFSFPFVFDRSPPVLRVVGAASQRFRAKRDYTTLGYSGSGAVKAQVAAVDLLVPSPSPNASTSGCEVSDFAGFPRDAVALLQRGTCFFRVKLANAVAAGASAIVVFNEGNPGRRDVFAATLGAPQASIAGLAASFEVGDELRNGVRNGPTGATVRLETDVVAERRRARNVIAETRVGNPARLVVVGAHLDSVQLGPGMNDNGSGSAVILEVAEQLRRLRPSNRVRFVWWGAEELGLLGSRHYVGRLSRAGRSAHALYINLDMVGSPNFGRFVYDGDASRTRSSLTLHPASGAIERVFARYFDSRGLAYRETSLGGNSDHAPFAQAGIPIGGLFTGADGVKSSAEAAAFGGEAGRPYDPCYHRACDNAANVSGVALTQIAGAAAHAVRRFARDVSGVRR